MIEVTPDCRESVEAERRGGADHGGLWRSDAAGLTNSHNQPHHAGKCKVVISYPANKLNVMGTERLKIYLFLTDFPLLSVILCLVSERSVLRKNRSHRFILSLSVADLSLSLFVLLPYLFSQPGNWWLGMTLCKVCWGQYGAFSPEMERIRPCQF